MAWHSLVESLVFYPALPEVFAGFWCWGKIRENNFLFLKEKDRESVGEQVSGARGAGGCSVDGAREQHGHGQILLQSRSGHKEMLEHHHSDATVPASRLLWVTSLLDIQKQFYKPHAGGSCGADCSRGPQADSINQEWW